MQIHVCVWVFDRWMKDRLSHRGKNTVCLGEKRSLHWLHPHALLSLLEGQFRVTLRRDFKFRFHRSFNFYDEGGKTVVVEQCRDVLFFFLSLSGWGVWRSGVHFGGQAGGPTVLLNYPTCHCCAKECVCTWVRLCHIPLLCNIMCVFTVCLYMEAISCLLSHTVFEHVCCTIYLLPIAVGALPLTHWVIVSYMWVTFESTLLWKW